MGMQNEKDRLKHQIERQENPTWTDGLAIFIMFLVVCVVGTAAVIFIGRLATYFWRVTE